MRTWSQSRCLVTGGFGFGGSHLCEQLLERGATVFVLDRVGPARSYLAQQGHDARVRWLPGDVRDFALIAEATSKHEIDTVFHVAAQPIVPHSNTWPLETFEVNATGTYHVLEAARRAGVERVVFASSGAYYGSTDDDAPIAETHPPLPSTNVYAASKVAADVAVRSYARTFGLKAVCCRFMNTYGPGDANFSRLVPRAIKHLLTGAEYDFGDRDDGRTRLDFLHVADMARGYLAAAEGAERHAGEAFNFGPGVATSTREVVRKVSALFDGRERAARFGGAPRAKPLAKHLDISKAAALLGWQPTVRLERGLEQTLAWYRNHWERL